jgi:SAM-dependent methyltransferase
MTRSPFDALAHDYDAARPRYPDQLYDAVADLSAVAWRGARVADVGAGTGIASRAILARGARVVAVDIGEGVLGVLRDRDAAPVAVIGDAHHLPLRAAAVDLVTFAQAWHWVDVPRAAAEVARVLRPGGALAVWWNEVDAVGEPWWDEQQERLEAGSPGYVRSYRERPYGDELAATGAFAAVTAWHGRWQREIDLDTYERWLRSKSYVAALGDGLADFLAAERESLSRAFPDGIVREPFAVRLWVARRGDE